MRPLTILRDTLLVLAFGAVLVGFMIALPDAIPHYGVTMP